MYSHILGVYYLMIVNHVGANLLTVDFERLNAGPRIWDRNQMKQDAWGLEAGYPEGAWNIESDLEVPRGVKSYTPSYKSLK